MSRPLHELRREQGSIDIEFEEMRRYVVDELGVPEEDAHEVVRKRLGRPPAVPSRSPRIERPAPRLPEPVRPPPPKRMVPLTLGGSNFVVKVSG